MCVCLCVCVCVYVYVCMCVSFGSHSNFISGHLNSRRFVLQWCCEPSVLYYGSREFTYYSKWSGVCVCVYMCVYMCKCVYVYVCICVCVYVCVCVCVCVLMIRYIRTYMQTYSLIMLLLHIKYDLHTYIDVIYKLFMY